MREGILAWIRLGEWEIFVKYEKSNDRATKEFQLKNQKQSTLHGLYLQN